MRKALFVVVLSTMLLFGFASMAFAKNAGSAAIPAPFPTWQTVNTWAAASVDATAQAAGPHSNYTTNTVKCVVCHSVHTAPEDSWLLTPISDADGMLEGTAAARVCAYCHGIGGSVSTKIVSINRTTANSPHSSRCTGATACHARSPHGVGASTYPVLAKKLLTNRADTHIAEAIADPKVPNIDATTFAAANVTNGEARTLAAGYVCSSNGACHEQSAFGVSERGDKMRVGNGGTTAFQYRTGHPVYVEARSEWVKPFGSAFGTGAIAWAPATGCASCHDVVDDRTGKAAFPHNRVVPSGGVAGGANDRLWMTKASDASLADSTKVTGTLTGAAGGVSLADGTCLKCHVSADGTAGVGKNF